MPRLRLPSRSRSRGRRPLGRRRPTRFDLITRGRSRPPLWAPLVAVVATALFATVVRVLLRRRASRVIDLDASAHAPEPLTGDPASVDAEDVAPVR